MLALLTAISLASSGLDAGVIDCTTQLDAAQLDAELPSPPSLADLIRAQVAPEILQGFDTILLTQINAIFGSENLPVANGGPVEPGIYVTVSPQQLLIFDAKVGDLQDGVVPPGPASRECQSGCKASLWSAFRQVWLRSLEEAQTFVLEVPVRVLFAVEASVPAKTLVEIAYAAAETRPGEPPSFSLLVNGSNAGLRSRSFMLLPPGGLRVSPGDNALGLRVTLGAGESFTISAAHPRFAPNVEGTGWKSLAGELARIKKGYPNKTTIIIDVGDDATIGDVVMAMVAAQQHFAETVLTNGLPVRWG
ncbi:MAG TPA: hypothetical protein VK034_20045 [Enhygromyxa sp.]|nr:hypothetical protein [Enhygromyxa sp.]